MPIEMTKNEEAGVKKPHTNLKEKIASLRAIKNKPWQIHKAIQELSDLADQLDKIKRREVIAVTHKDDTSFYELGQFLGIVKYRPIDFRIGNSMEVAIKLGNSVQFWQKNHAIEFLQGNYWQSPHIQKINIYGIDSRDKDSCYIKTYAPIIYSKDEFNKFQPLSKISIPHLIESYERLIEKYEIERMTKTQHSEKVLTTHKI